LKTEINTLFANQKYLKLILDNLIEGIMAHTADRRIFFFNKEAERITGFRREDVLGRDCHEVFPGRFCGGSCEFCNDASDVKHTVSIKKDVSYIRSDGRERILKMSCLPLTDEDGTCIGALLSFTDDTELKILKTRSNTPYVIEGLVGHDPTMLVIFDQIHEVSSVYFPVLIEGESGTGKELVANAIHNLGPRSDKPFVAINCGALPEDILESELFGHVKGAFSGAVQSRKGRFELADGGTIFLDEIGEMSLSSQVKLLRVLQEKRFERVGGEVSVQVNVRIIAATNQNLRKLIEKKKFRRDLFYRLCVIPMMMPPLRQRPSDIPVLAEHFLKLTAKELGRPVLTLLKEVMDIFLSYPWPGNVRELRNVIEYAYVKCRSHTINVGDLPPELSGSDKEKPLKTGNPMISKEIIQRALKNADGNKKKAASELGIGRATLYRYLESYQLK
jgi:PAS domain S-box-containing protein